MTLKPMVKADSKIELTAGVSSYLNSVMLGKIEPTVVQNEPVVVEQTYVEPTVPTCRKKYSCSRFRKLERVCYPYEFTLLSNGEAAALHPDEVCYPYGFTLLSN